MKWFGLLVAAALMFGCQTRRSAGEAGRARPVRRLERIVAAPDGRGFVTAESKQPFHPFGMNYGNAGRLMEDFWDTDWQTFAADFGKLKALGANVVRVHLQFGKFMQGPSHPNRAALRRFARMLKLAEATGAVSRRDRPCLLPAFGCAQVFGVSLVLFPVAQRQVVRD